MRLETSCLRQNGSRSRHCFDKLNIGDPAAVGGFKAPAHISRRFNKPGLIISMPIPCAGILEARGP